MKPTASKLIRWAGLSAMVAGIIFAIIQPIHPPEIISSVTTGRWVIIHSLTLAMCLFGLLGLAGLYARQVKEVGWLGLAGYLLFSLFYALVMVFSFAEAFIMPQLATEAPKFVEGFITIFNGGHSEANLGALATFGPIGAGVYILGPVLFGIATFRAGILPRWAGGLIAFGAVSPLLATLLLPQEFVRYTAVLMGLGLVWLGYALWSERRAQATDPDDGVLMGVDQPAAVVATNGRVPSKV